MLSVWTGWPRSWDSRLGFGTSVRTVRRMGMGHLSAGRELPVLIQFSVQTCMGMGEHSLLRFTDQEHLELFLSPPHP